MNLATAPRRVSPARAAMAPNAEPIRVDPAVPTSAPRVEPLLASEYKAEAANGSQKKYASSNQLNSRCEGISVNALRRNDGVEFESYCAVVCGGRQRKLLDLIFPCTKERDFVAYGEVLRYILIKNDVCFVFIDQHGLSPLYCIPLINLNLLVEDPKHPDPDSITVSPSRNKNQPKLSLVTILLKECSGKIAFQFTFDTSRDKELAMRFVFVINNAIARGKKGISETSPVIHADMKQKSKN